MNLPHDRQIAAWLAVAGPQEGPPEPLARALAATRWTRKRPRWTFPERWLPVQLTLTRTPSLRPAVAIVTLALLTVALVATALYIGSQRRLPAPLFRNGAVVYAADGDLFVVDQVHGTPRPLGVGPGATVPAFSPQGDRIAFMREGISVPISVLTVRRDGSDVTELASWGGWYGRQVRWAPDGSALVATSDGLRDGGAAGTGPSAWQLTVIAADGSGFRKVRIGLGKWAGRAEWRPDGRNIAFVGYTRASASRAVYIADRDGTNVRALPGATDVASNGVAWSPDGTRLAFLSYRPDRTVEITIAFIDVDGTVSGLTSIPPDPAIEDVSHTGPPVEVGGITPRWSPDGSQLAYGVVRGSIVPLGIVGSDGSGSRIVEPVGGGAPTDLGWSPDGRSLVVIHDGANASGLPGADGIQHAWLLDLATGEETSADELIGDWQRLAH